MFPAGHGQKATKRLRPTVLSPIEERLQDICEKNKYYGLLNPGTTMKPQLHLKIALLIAYLALCTHLVLTAVQDDTPASAAIWGQAAHY
jgi:hypothetical protein